MVFYTNGYFATSADIDESGKSYTRFDWDDLGNHINDNDELIVKINTNTMKALIWDYSKLGVEDIKFDKYDKDNQFKNVSITI